MRQPSTPRPPLTGRHLTAATAATAAVLLVAGCGSATTAASGGAPGGAGGASGSPAPCGTALPTAPGGAPQPAELAQGGARITAVGPTCFAYEVTNPHAEPYDYTVVFDGPDPDGGAAVFGGPGSGGGNLTRTVTALAPGATEKGRIELGGPGAAGSGSRPGAPTPNRPGIRPPKPELLKVRSVPTAEAPGAGGPCPPSGLRLYADEGSAAMGLRAVGLHLRNCGTATVVLDGYPQVQPLDVDHQPLDGVRILRGGAEIATGTGADDPPQTFDLRPGEGARAVLAWRNTTEAGTPQNAPYVRVRATPGAAPVTVVPELDLGTTGRLGAGAWTREDTRTQDGSTARP
ncbi:DUF4232 domain-containing protein [Kitasatospora sp. NPDC002543]